MVRRACVSIGSLNFREHRIPTVSAAFAVCSVRFCMHERLSHYVQRCRLYWESRQSSLHGLIFFLGGSAGITALHLMHLPDKYAEFISGACMVLGAVLITPNKQ